MEGLEVGRNVHYVQPNGAHSVATVTRIWSDERGTVDLYVMRDDEIQDNYNASTVVHSEEPVPYTWHFIEGEETPTRQETFLPDADTQQKE